MSRLIPRSKDCLGLAPWLLRAHQTDGKPNVARERMRRHDVVSEEECGVRERVARMWRQGECVVKMRGNVSSRCAVGGNVASGGKVASGSM